MIAGLDEDQLEKLERIMSKDLDSATEFQMLHDELVEMGMDEEDVQDLLDLSKMMVQFVSFKLIQFFYLLKELPTGETINVEKLNLNSQGYLHLVDHL